MHAAEGRGLVQLHVRGPSFESLCRTRGLERFGILSWPHTGFNVHSLVRTKTKPEAERVGKYMLRPVLALERLTFLEADGKVDPMLCPKCGGRMKVIAFLTDFSVVDRIIGHLKLTFVAERPPPPRVASQELLMAADPPAEYFS